MPHSAPQLPWLESGDALPPIELAWGPMSPAPGLLAAGGALDVPHLIAAYSQATFPWFSAGQPILWWSPDPRMVLEPAKFRLHRSLHQTIKKWRNDPACEIRMDTAFGKVIRHCASAPRAGQRGTWILPSMINAYCALHAEGFAHSVEAWRGSELVGGLYCVAIGQAVFGESMFAHETDASKIALAALVAFCHTHQITAIDCQQNTQHLASLGASEWPRAQFAQHVADTRHRPAPAWIFQDLYWSQLLPQPTPPTP